MKWVIDQILSAIKYSRKATAEEVFYSQSTDLADLERRMRLVQRGQAPFQKPYMGWPV